MKLYRVEQYEGIGTTDTFLYDDVYPDRLTIEEKDKYDDLHMKYFQNKESAIKYAREAFNKAYAYFSSKYAFDNYEEDDVMRSFLECPTKGISPFSYPDANPYTIAMGCIHMDDLDKGIDFWYEIHVDEFIISSEGPDVYRIEEYDYGDDEDLLVGYADHGEGCREGEEEGYYGPYWYAGTLQKARELLRQNYTDKIKELERDMAPELIYLNSEIIINEPDKPDGYTIVYRDNRESFNRWAYSDLEYDAPDFSNGSISNIVGRIIKLKIEK